MSILQHRFFYGTFFLTNKQTKIMNVDFSEIKIKALAVHGVGNSGRDEGINISKSLYPINEDEDLEFILLDYFTKSFSKKEFFEFDSKTYSTVLSSCKNIFAQPKCLYNESVKILRHLYRKSDDLTICSGELYVVLLQDFLIEDELVNGIGIFKSEKKKGFIDALDNGNDDVRLSYSEGIDIKKIDKGCIVFNTEHDGFRVIKINGKAKKDVHYWAHEFLSVSRVKDDLFYTEECLKMLIMFNDKIFNEKATPLMQIRFLKRAIDYFQDNDLFEWEDFIKVLERDMLAEDMENLVMCKGYIEHELEINLTKPFAISDSVVKKLKRKFKTNILTDTNFELIISTDVEDLDSYLEKGYDEKKEMNFYKIFYVKES